MMSLPMIRLGEHLHLKGKIFQVHTVLAAIKGESAWLEYLVSASAMPGRLQLLRPIGAKAVSLLMDEVLTDELSSAMSLWLPQQFLFRNNIYSLVDEGELEHRNEDDQLCYRTRFALYRLGDSFIEVRQIVSKPDQPNEILLGSVVATPKASFVDPAGLATKSRQSNLLWLSVVILVLLALLAVSFALLLGMS
jgi:hypothetical protein